MSHHHKTKILAIDDCTTFHALYSGLLLASEHNPHQEFELRCLSSVTDIKSVLEEYQPKVVILEVNLPGVSGVNICKTIRDEANHHHSYTGIVFVSADNSLENVIKCLEAGADDFCVKAHAEQELLPRIKSVLRIVKMAESLQSYIKRLRVANRRLERISITDELSKLYSMKYFRRRLKEEFSRAERYKKHLSLLMFDLDHFKQVNDNFDHLLGSFVIAQIGPLVTRNIRRNVDMAARYGGDEYIIMMPETNAEGAAICAEKIRKMIAEHVFDNGRHRVQITASIGVASIAPDQYDHYENALDLIREADGYLYEAKARGRACVVDARSSDKTKAKKIA